MLRSCIGLLTAGLLTSALFTACDTASVEGGGAADMYETPGDVLTGGVDGASIDHDVASPGPGDIVSDDDTALGEPDGARASDTAGRGEVEEKPSWTSILPAGDPVGDCATAGDPDCAADIVDLLTRRDGDTLELELRFDSPLPANGSWEVFLIPEDVLYVGYTFRYADGEATYFKADCSSAQKHAGCHWFEFPTVPDHVHLDTSRADRPRLQLSWQRLGFESAETVFVGVAAAPFSIARTAEFTDRFPDATTVTGSAITGLTPLP